MAIKWTEQDVIDAVDKALAGSPQDGSNQLLQQLRGKVQQVGNRLRQPFTRETK